MFKYILRRVGYMLLTLFIISTVTFFMMHLIPGDPLGAMANKLPEQAKANYYAKYGLDKALFEQYTIFLKQLITEGDLGESLKYPGKSVTETLLTNSKVSGVNGAIALTFGVSTGIIMGIIAALNKNKWPDYLITFIAMMGITIPAFVLASMFQYLFSVKWQLLPTSGWGEPKYMILPIMTMCIGGQATYVRYIKANMLEVMGQDYIMTAEAKGVDRFHVIKDHVMKNAFLPCITILVGQISGIFTGSFIIEKMFGIPGLGFYYVSSINDRDYTMIIGTTIFAAALFVVAQLIIDIAYTIFDPRIRIK